MKSSGRKQEPELTGSGIEEPHLSTHDNSSFISSDGSAGSASTSAGDSMSHLRNSSEYVLLKRARSAPEAEPADHLGMCCLRSGAAWLCLKLHLRAVTFPKMRKAPTHPRVIKTQIKM